MMSVFRAEAVQLAKQTTEGVGYPVVVEVEECSRGVRSCSRCKGCRDVLRSCGASRFKGAV